nr:extracellular solute-binding protein [Chloroflexia bacterium]
MNNENLTTADHRPEQISTISRRTIIKAGAAATAASLAMPYFYISRSSAQAEQMTFWHFYAPSESPDSPSAWFENTISAWNAENEAKVATEFVPTPEYVGGSRLQTAFASGEGPDIFLLSPGDFLRYHNGGALLDLTPYLSAEVQSDFFPEVMATRSVDGKIFGLPMEVGAMAMYYSIQAFEEAGLSEADIPTTWD